MTNAPPPPQSSPYIRGGGTTLEIARKGVHIALAIAFAYLGPHIGPVYTALLALGMFAVVVLARHIRHIQTLYRVGRVSYGEVFFAIGVLASALLFLPAHPDAFVTGMLILGIADPLATLIGMRFGTHVYHVWGDKKSLEGSLACTLASVCILFVAGVSPTHAFVGGALLALVEACAPRGSDNLLLPLVAGAVVMTSLL